MPSTFKLGLLYGASGTAGSLFLGGLFALAPNAPFDAPAILLCGLPLALSAASASFVASRRGWLLPSISVGRAVLASLPLAFLPVALIIGWIGWGDMQEHWIRALLHLTHREVTGRIAGVLIMVGVTVISGIACGLLVWMSVSLLKRLWRLRMLFLSCTACAVLVGAFWSATFATSASKIVLFVGLLLIFAFGFLYGLATEAEARPHIFTQVVRYFSACVLLVLIAGASTIAALSQPEKTFSQLRDGPVWSFNLASTGCQRAWGDPDTSAATNEIAFAGDDTVAMAYATMVAASSEKNLDYQACIFTIDAKSGTKISQIRLDERRPVTSFYQPIIAGTSDGNIRLTLDEFFTVYGRGLEVVAARQPIAPSTEHWTGAHWKTFRAERDGTLWYDASSGPKQLGRYAPDATFIYPLGLERVLVIAGRRFALFRKDGTQVAEESFTREGVHFASVSADHRRFAVSVYLWGVGDPSYLEEERIVVYDSENGAVVTAVPSNPLPTTQSWTALSPDGSLLAVGARTTLRLFRLPPVSQSKSK